MEINIDEAIVKKLWCDVFCSTVGGLLSGEIAPAQKPLRTAKDFCGFAGLLADAAVERYDDYWNQTGTQEDEKNC